jgi:DNA-binding PadR family transcriptional regulator
MARRKTDQTERGVFAGFDRPEANYFKMPNSWTDITAAIDSIAELKVVEYILRHTWGYQEYGLKKHITIDEFVRGRRRQDGSRMDRGTGLSERAVYDGLRKAVASGLIEEESDDSDRGRVKKSYSLKMRENRQADADVQHLQAGVQTLHPPLQDVHPDPQTLQARGARTAPRSEKDTRERHIDVSKFEGSHAPFGDVENDAAPAGQGGRHVAGPTSAPAGDRTLRHGRERPATGYASLREVIARRRAAGDLPRRGRPAGRDEERERLRPFLEDFARELGDEAPLSSTITRALNIFQAAGVPPERWSDLLYQARGLTQERTAQIRKTATTGGEQLRRKNKMPYFLATLEQLVGLRPEPPRRERPG